MALFSNLYPGIKGAQGIQGIQGTSSGPQGTQGTQGIQGGETKGFSVTEVNGPYSLQTSDVGNLIKINSGISTVSISSNTFSFGNSFMVYNGTSNTQTISQGVGVSFYSGDGTATIGNKSLNENEMATILCSSSNDEFIFSGVYYIDIVRDGLVLLLDSGNTESYPGSGTTWYDLSGNGYNHTLISSPLTTIDGVSCFDVSASGRYIVDSGTTFTFSSSHTMIAWARPLADSQVSTWRTLWRTTPNDHPLLIQDSTNLIGYYDNNLNVFESYGLNAGTLGIENKWTMFTLVASGGSTTCYINNLSASGTVAYTTSGNNHDAFGNEFVGGGSQPFGYVSVAQIYNRALTAAEIEQNFEALRGRFGL